MSRPGTHCRARAAREAVGLTLAIAARRARVGVSYLARLERTGSFSFVLARRLSGIYGASLEAFLPHPTTNEGGGAPQSGRPEPQPAGRRRRRTGGKVGIG